MVGRPWPGTCWPPGPRVCSLAVRTMAQQNSNDHPIYRGHRPRSSQAITGGLCTPPATAPPMQQLVSEADLDSWPWSWGSSPHHRHDWC